MSKRRCGAALILVALVAAGCGSGDDTTGEATATAARSNPAPGTPPVVEDVASRLRAAGIPAKGTTLDDGEAEVQVRGAEIVYYTDPSETTKWLRLAAKHPQSMLADTYGQVVVAVFTASPNKPLTSAERARFEEISTVVDPQR